MSNLGRSNIVTSIHARNLEDLESANPFEIIPMVQVYKDLCYSTCLAANLIPD